MDRPRLAWTVTTGLGAIVTWFAMETFDAWFFDKVVKSIEPRWELVLRYGVPAAFAAACIYMITRLHLAAARAPTTFAEQARLVYPPGAKHIERISVLDFYKQAQWSGFNLMGGSRTALTIAQDVRQAALDGTLQTWGKTNPTGSPLVKIPAEHWKEFRLYWEQCFRIGPPDGQIVGFADDNSLVGTNGARTTNDGRRGYLDVHLDLEQAKALLA